MTCQPCTAFIPVVRSLQVFPVIPTEHKYIQAEGIVLVKTMVEDEEYIIEGYEYKDRETRRRMIYKATVLWPIDNKNFFLTIIPKINLDD